MKKQILCLALLSLTACGKSEESKENKAVRLNGTCTTETIDTYNTLSAQVQSFQKESTVENLQKVKNSCINFSSLIGDRTCTAKDTASESLVDVSYAKVKPMCDIAIAGTASPGTAYEKGLSIVTQDSSSLNFFLQYQQEFGGKETYCQFTRNRTGLGVTDGSVLRLNFSAADSNGHIQFISDDQNLQLSCTKTSGGTFNKTDIQDIFGGTAQVIVNQ